MARLGIRLCPIDWGAGEPRTADHANRQANVTSG
jgi:hypothetical protein